MTQANYKYSFSDLPSVDKLLSSESFKELLADYGHTLLSQEVRDVLDGLRQKIRSQENVPLALDADDVTNQFAVLVKKNLQSSGQSKLRSVFNLPQIQE